MIRLLDNVDPAGMVPETLLAIAVAEPIWNKWGADVLWVTSIKDGVHKPGSFHYRGRAVDLRVKNLPQTAWDLAATELRAALGPRYDVLLEMNPPHVHVEFDNKVQKGTNDAPPA